MVLNRLALDRKLSVPDGYNGIAAYRDGAYECDFVSPYTKSAGSSDAEWMLILQDWCSDEYLSGPYRACLATLGHDPTLPTNRNLKSLLEEQCGCTLADTYATNLFPFIKPGSMSGAIPSALLTQMAHRYALPQIEAVGPKQAIVFGVASFNAMRRAVNLRPIKNIDEGLRSPFAVGQTMVWCQSHPGGLGRANRGGRDGVTRDWQLMLSRNSAA